MKLNKRIYYIVLIFPLLISILFASPAIAQPVNVLDCLENGEDCEEDKGDEVVELDESNKGSDLVGNDSFKASSLFFNIVKLIVALFFVLALIYIILLVLRRRNKLLQNHDLLENLGGISLGQNKSLQLIRIGSHIYVVGVGEHVDLMLEITEPEVLEALLNAEKTSEEIPFLQSLFSKEKSKADSKGNFLNKLDDELNKLQKNRKKLVHKAIEKDDEHV